MSTANTSGIPDLWPEEIVFTPVLSPKAILQHQAELLGKKANGYLRAHVTSSQEGSNSIHELTLVAPVLDGYSRPILSIRHNQEFPYPCQVHADGMVSGEGYSSDPAALHHWLSEVFSSPKTRSIIFSMLARITEKAEVSTP